MTGTLMGAQFCGGNLLRLVGAVSTDGREGVRAVADNGRRPTPTLAKHALYSQVYEFLARRISNGMWKPGAILPNEQDLARELGVSPGTMRKALDKLEADRIIVRRQGRGTFVVDHSEKELAARFSNIVNAEGRRMVPTEITVIAREVGHATEVERAYLNIRDGEKVIRTRRTYGHAAHPYLYEEACLAVDRLPGLQADDVAGSYVLAQLAQRCGVQLARAVEKVALAEAASELVGLLALPSGSVLLTLDRLVFSLDGQPLEWRIAACNLQNESYVAEML